MTIPLPPELRNALRFLAIVAWLPLLLVTLLAFSWLCLIGGRDLVTYAVGLAFTGKGALRIVTVFVGVTFIAWFGPPVLDRLFWDAGGPPPMWLRRSLRVNLIEIAVFVAVILAGV